MLNEIQISSTEDEYLVSGEDLPILIGSAKEAEIYFPDDSECKILCKMSEVGGQLAIETLWYEGNPVTGERHVCLCCHTPA